VSDIFRTVKGWTGSSQAENHIMENTLSNKYYVQAFDAYPYDLTETLESLSFALSYESDHAGAHCLLGRLYMEHLLQFDKASYHFEQALISDMNFVPTYEHYCKLLIQLKEYGKAEKLIRFAYKIDGIHLPSIQHKEALLNEHRKNLVAARKLMKLAYENSCIEEERKFLKNEAERIKLKLNETGKKSGKGKKKSR